MYCKYINVLNTFSGISSGNSLLDTEKPSLFSDSEHYQTKRKFCEDTERSSEESEIVDNQYLRFLIPRNDKNVQSRIRLSVSKICIGFLSLFFCFSFLYAQELKPILEIKTKRPLMISVDKAQSLFVADEKGNINKYDSLGKFVLNYSPPKISEITLLEAWPTVRIFAFYQNFQESKILDRFLNPIADYPVNEQWIGFAQLMTVAGDNNLWVLDNRDFSLKKYNPQTNELILHNSLDLILNPENYEINFMREYQNLLFVNDKNSGILLFDNFGNYKKTLPYIGLNYVGVHENEIVLLKDKVLIFYDLYKNSERKISLPANENWLFATTIHHKIVALTTHKIIFFDFL